MGVGMVAWKPVITHVKEGMDVALVGLGGVGHFVCKFATALGAKVTCFSHSVNKEDEALDVCGAYHFVYVSDDEKAIPLGYKNVFDLVVFTAPVKYNYDSLFRSAKPGGKVCLIGTVGGEPTELPQDVNITFDDSRLNPFPTENPPVNSQAGDDAKHVTVVWSNGGSPKDYDAMFAFVDKHKITVNTAAERFNVLQETLKGIEDSPAVKNILFWSTAHL
jgi:D-arabinose 1-dehydrogenase-like Zn-dependent alcohol dehydrogenase